MNKTLGVILIVLGLFGLAWGGFTYHTTETVVDLGPIHATREKEHNIPLPPIAGAAALIGGIGWSLSCWGRPIGLWSAHRAHNRGYARPKSYRQRTRNP